MGTRLTFRSYLALLLGFLVVSLTADAWARAGGGSSSGSRGSRSYSSPSRSYSTPTPSAPSATPYTQPTAPLPAAPTPTPAGGFLRSLAGGVVGGLLGGMLFRSLGFAGGAGGFGGGFGMMDLLLLGGIAFLIYWMVRRRRAAVATAGGPAFPDTGALYTGGGTGAASTALPDRATGLQHIRQMDPGFDEATFRESASDQFFQIQAAWMHRDLDRLRPLLTDELLGTFRTNIETARANRQVNKLENISVRSVELTEAWQEQGQDYATVRFLANLLDYTVDEATGRVVSGSDTTPVKFEEYWTWVRPVGPQPWKLSAITQPD